MHGAVVGAGLAGIAMTHALRRTGISVDLFEQAPEARSTGYQLNVLQNGKYALEQIGLLDALRNSGYGAPMNAIVFINGLTGRIMVRAALAPAGDYRATSFYRGDLHKTLLEALEGEAPQCNRAVEVVDDDASRGKVILRFADGEVRDFDFVIGADGAHSKIRCHIFPEHRGFVPCFDALLFAAHIDLNGSSAAERSFAEQVRQGEFVIVIAPGAEVVLSAAGGGRFGVIMRFDDPRRAREVSTPEDAKALARTLARDIRDPRIHLAIDLSFWEPGNPLIWHIGDIDPSRKFHAGRIALSGDAAHAMLPVVGQGANQAFEDAMVLARQLGSRGDSDIAPAFERYSAERALHVAHVQQTGRRYARGFTSSPMLHRVNSILMPLLMRRFHDRLENHTLKYVIGDPRRPITARL